MRSKSYQCLWVKVISWKMLIFLPGHQFNLVWFIYGSRQSSQRVWAKKTWNRNTPFWEKKTQFQQKIKALFGIISFLKRVFCLPLLHKISPFNVFKTINYLFFNISKIGPWGPELIWYLATKNNKVQGTCDNWPWRNCSEAGRGRGG